jgi:voltage-gated potassium channel
MLAVAAAVEGAAPTLASLKKSLREAVERDPFDANVVTVAGGAFLFYLAEKGKNPKVQTYWDALVFVSTCMSVGYADVFARTPAGKAIASAIMTIGPALSGAILDEPRPAGAPAETSGAADRIALQRIIVEKLEAILMELRALRAEG